MVGVDGRCVFVYEKRWEDAGELVFDHDFIKIQLGGHLNNLRAKKNVFDLRQVLDREKLDLLEKFYHDLMSSVLKA